MHNKEISNEDYRLDEFNKELKELRDLIEEETRVKRAKGIKGTRLENESSAQWALNKFPATAQEKAKQVAAHEAARTRKEDLFQKDVEAELEIRRAKLERGHFGALGLKGFQEQEARLRKMDEFSARNRKREAFEKAATKYKREKEDEAQKIIQKQKDRKSDIQDNRAYQPKGDEKIKSEFTTKATQTKTVSMEFDAQNKKVKDMAAYTAKLEEEKKQEIKNQHAVDFKKQQEQKNKAVIEKQTPSITVEQDNTVIKNIDAGTEFNHSSGAKESDVKQNENSTDRDRAAADFIKKVKERDQRRSMKHDHGKGHTH